MSNLPGTRRSLLQALLCSADGAFELVRQHDQHLGELFGRRPLDFGLIEEEIQLVRHAARQLGDSRKSERTAGALQLMRDEKELGEGLFELRSEAEAVLADEDGGLVDVLEIVALQRAEFLGHEGFTSEKDAALDCGALAPLSRPRLAAASRQQTARLRAAASRPPPE